MKLHARITQAVPNSFHLYEFIQAKFLIVLGLLVNIEFGRMSNEAVVTLLEVISRHEHGWPEYAT
jgi:hypothetical protein